MWAKFFAAALKDSDHPSFKDFPWTFSPWEGKMQTMLAVGVRVAERERLAEPQPDQDHHADAEADADRRRSRRRPTTKPPKPTPTPTGTPSAAPKQVVVSSWSPTGRRNLAASDVRAAGIGSGGTGAAGAVVHWLAGLFGL